MTCPCKVSLHLLCRSFLGTGKCYNVFLELSPGRTIHIISALPHRRCSIPLIILVASSGLTPTGLLCLGPQGCSTPGGLSLIGLIWTFCYLEFLLKKKVRNTKSRVYEIYRIPDSTAIIVDARSLYSLASIAPSKFCKRLDSRRWVIKLNISMFTLWSRICLQMC